MYVRSVWVEVCGGNWSSCIPLIAGRAGAACADGGHAAADYQGVLPPRLEAPRQRLQLPRGWTVSIGGEGVCVRVRVRVCVRVTNRASRKTHRTCPQSSSSHSSLIGGSDSKLIYRHYATLYFVFAVDSSESELAILDLIQVQQALPRLSPPRQLGHPCSHSQCITCPFPLLSAGVCRVARQAL